MNFLYNGFSHNIIITIYSCFTSVSWPCYSQVHPLFFFLKTYLCFGIYHISRREWKQKIDIMDQVAIYQPL